MVSRRSPMQGYTLVIHTARPDGMIALVRGSNVVAKRTGAGHGKGGYEVLQRIDEVLKQEQVSTEDIQRIIVHPGPGNFSALRAGVVAALMFAQASGVQLFEAQGSTAKEMVRNAYPVETITPRYT
jgi:tRNA A37 threonylcarbamoyladenosine modification protein TsaB